MPRKHPFGFLNLMRIFMDKNTDKNFTPLLPYDITFAENFEMYDSFGYINNRDKTAPILHLKESGNLVKYYSQGKSEKIFKIGIDKPEKTSNKYKK